MLVEKSEHTELFFVNRFSIPFPREPLRLPIAHAIRGALRLQDRWQERKLSKANLSAVLLKAVFFLLVFGGALGLLNYALASSPG